MILSDINFSQPSIKLLYIAILASLFMKIRSVEKHSMTSKAAGGVVNIAHTRSSLNYW